MLAKLSQLFLRYALPISTLRSFIYGPPTLAGVSVSEETALGISAVYRAVDLISTTIAGLDPETKRDIPGRGKVTQERHPVTLVLKDPNDYSNGFKFWRTYILHTLLSGNGFAEIERATDDTPLKLHLLHWRNVRIDRKEDGTLVYHLLREGKDIPAQDVLHLTMNSLDGIVGISPIRAHRETLGISVAAERYAASVYGNGATTRGFLKVNGVPSPETKASIREAWESIHAGLDNANKIGILSGDTEWVDTNMTPEDAQLILSRAFQISEVARIFGVPVNLLFSADQSSYNSNQESNLQFYQLGIKGLLENLEAEIDCKIVDRRSRLLGYHVKYKVDSLLVGLVKLQSDTWRPLVLSGIATQNEARERLGLNPVDDGDILLVPTNVAVVSALDGTDKTTAGLPAPKADPLGLPAPPPDDTVKNALRIAYLDHIGRALRRQAKSADPDHKTRDYLIVSLSAMHRAYCVTEGITTSVEEFAQRWIDYTAGKDLQTITPEEVLHCLRDE